MKIILRSFISVIAMATLAFAKDAPKSAEEIIREFGRQAGVAAAQKDAATCAAPYAVDAVMLHPNSPTAKGIEAIRSQWKELLETPGLVIDPGTFVVPEKIEVFPGDGIAVETGSTTIAIDGLLGRSTYKSRYLVVWRKFGEDWKIVHDAVVPDAPATQP